MIPGLPELVIENRQRGVRLDLERISLLTRLALPACRKSILTPRCPLASLTRIEVVILGDRKMATVHREFLGIPGPTDVITFPYGEILVCAGEAERNSSRFGNTGTDEVALYIIHGLLHLADFDDTTPMAARKMTLQQDKIFRAVRKALC